MSLHHSVARLGALSLLFGFVSLPSVSAARKEWGETPAFTIGFSSFVGGTGRDRVTAVAFDGVGNVILAGETTSADFPVAQAGQGTRKGPTDAFVVKVARDGSRIVHATYVGGSADDRASGVAVDPEGNIYVTGVTTSLDFPVTPGAYDLENGRFPTCQGGDCIDSFVVKIPSDGGPFVYATYLGGEHDDYSAGIAVGADGSVFIAGSTNSFGIPRDNAFEPDKKQGSEGFITKLDATGSDVVFSSYIGGNRGDGATAIAVTPDGGAVFAGTSFSLDFLTKYPLQAANSGGSSPEMSLDGFVARVTADGALSWSTYLGGIGRDAIRAVTVDEAGDIIVAGTTDSTSFPTLDPLQGTAGGSGDAFLARIAADGSALKFSTYVGGSGSDEFLAVAAASDGTIVAAGLTRSADLAVVDPVQGSCGGCEAPGFFADALVLRLSSGNVVEISTYLGGTGEEMVAGVAIDTDGAIAIGGHTFSAGFPVTAGSFGASCPCPPGSADNGFVATILPNAVVVIPPVLSQVTSAKRPYRLILSGDAFQSGATVFIGDDLTAWPVVTVGGPTSITIGGGKSLKQRFPKGVGVSIRVVNPDGGEGVAVYTR